MDMQDNLLVGLFSDFISYLKMLGRSKFYIRNIQSYLVSLSCHCHWSYLSSVNVRDFDLWRQSTFLSGKTKNNYLLAWKSFLNFCVYSGYLTSSPFLCIKPVRLGDSVRPRRALTYDECYRLLALSPPARSMVYRFALYTGLRRNEIFNLTWDDLYLETDFPYVLIRPNVSKSRKRQNIPLRSDLADRLLALRPYQYHTKLVFRRFYKCFRRDFDYAGIPLVDQEGNYADFHSLRKTFCTSLFLSSVSPRVVQYLMRHSDYKLTTACYTDTGLLGDLARKGVESLRKIEDFEHSEKSNGV